MTFNAPIRDTLFRPNGIVMLADVRAQAELLWEGNARRDVLSAFNVLQTRAGIDLGATPAAARGVRELFDSLTPLRPRRERQTLRQHPLTSCSIG